VFVLRRLTALLTALLLLFQADWQGSGAACLAGHAASHGGSKTVPAMAAGVQTAPAMEHDGMMGMALAHRAPGEASAVAVPSSTGGDETVPAHCPGSGISAACAAMMTCSAAATQTSAAPLLAIDAWRVGERAAESDARPRSRDAAPDVPPPRA
jgi:hypothetical protein